MGFVGVGATLVIEDEVFDCIPVVKFRGSVPLQFDPSVTGYLSLDMSITNGVLPLNSMLGM